MASNDMVTVVQQTERGLERKKEGKKEVVMPNRCTVPVFVWSAETKQRHLVRAVCGPAIVRTFQIQVQDVNLTPTLT